MLQRHGPRHGSGAICMYVLGIQPGGKHGTKSIGYALGTSASRVNEHSSLIKYVCVLQYSLPSFNYSRTLVVDAFAALPCAQLQQNGPCRPRAWICYIYRTPSALFDFDSCAAISFRRKPRHCICYVLLLLPFPVRCRGNH